jgi:pentatricopeptide repeat protein
MASGIVAQPTSWLAAVAASAAASPGILRRAHAALLTSGHLSSRTSVNSLLRASSIPTACALLLRFLLLHRLPPDHLSLSFSLHSCTRSPSLPIATLLHSLAVRLGHARDVYIVNAAVSAYFRAAHVASAERLFSDSKNIADVVTWTTMVTGHANAGDVERARWFFDAMPEKNVVSWNALICGYARNRRGQEALGAYEKMRAMGMKADNVTLLGLLFACNHAGLVDEGYSLFKTAQVEQPDILKADHYACVVDLLSRAKRFDDAKRFLEDLPFEPGVGFWKAMIGGCQIHWNKDLAESVAERIQALDPKDTSSYILLSNVYSAAGSWQSVSMVRRQIKEMGLKRITGCSWIQLQDKAHVFFNGDHRHPQSDEIYMMLELCLNTDEDDEHCLV